MAFTEKYVTVAGAGAHDGSSEANAWTFAEMIAAAPAAETRVNIKAGSYTEGATTLPASGTIVAPIVLRGYNATIGDLDSQGRGSDGLLNTANMPDIAVTATWTPSPFCICQNLDISGALSAALLSSSTADSFGFVNCRIANSQNNASAKLLLGDNYVLLINCDFQCTGASHGILIDADAEIQVYGCRFSTTLDSATALQCDSGVILKSVFVGSGSPSTAVGIIFSAYISSGSTMIAQNTFYNWGTAIQGPNSAPAGGRIPVISDNHITDCAKYIDNLYEATANIAVIEMNNRTRDNTTPRTGVLSAVLGAEITTDAGDYTTDYVSATNLRLIYGAAGVDGGMMTGTDCGAFNRDRPTLPAVADVQSDVQYGDAGTQYTGTFAVPAVADVQSDVAYGAAGAEFTGTFAPPAIGDVQSDVTYGAAAEFTGTFSVPAVGEVQSDVTYGAGGVEFTGTYAPACDYPVVGDVQSDVVYAGATMTGTFAVPAAADVQSDVTYGAAGVEFTGTFAAPAIGDVQSDVTYGAAAEFTGTFKVPAVGDVQSPNQYGAAGVEFTGTFTAPAAADVQSDVTYGAGGVEYTGTFAVPAVADVQSDVAYGAAGAEFTGTFASPAVANVHTGVGYGAGGAEFTGTLTHPLVGDVQSDVTYGAGGVELTGTFAVPAITDVHDGVSYGAGGAEFTGTLTHPAVTDVQSDVTYGAGGVELTGTFAAPAIGDVQSDVGYGAGGAEFAGTFSVPAEAEVKSDVTYGAAGAEFTGTLAGGGGGGSRPAII
jgi:hypothetical protein